MKEGHEAVYAELVPQLIELARACEFRDLDNVISYYRRCSDDLDDRPPQEKNGVFLSEVGDRFALNGDLDTVSGGYLRAALSAAIDDEVSRRRPQLGITERGRARHGLPFVSRPR